MQIKFQWGKLSLRLPLPDLVREQQELNGVQLLPIRLERLYQLSALPQHHREPFDRLLIAQAQVEDLIGDRLSALARGLAVNESRWRANSAFTPERIASDRIATTAVEDARPRMAQPAAQSAAMPSAPGYDTVSAIDEILREAENHV